MADVTKEMIEAGWNALVPTSRHLYIDKADVETILTAALSAAPQAVVKPLEWNDRRDDHTVFRIVQVAVILGADDLDGLNYMVLGPDRHGLYEVVFGNKIIMSCGSEEAAKAAAQADYERRILSALTTPPAQAEPVAWLHEWDEKDGKRGSRLHRNKEDAERAARNLDRYYLPLVKGSSTIKPLYASPTPPAVAVKQELDGTCKLCGAAPRNSDGLCATCVDEALTTPPAQAVAVKPLEWKALNEGFGHGRTYYGTGVFGHWYAVQRVKKGVWSCVHHVDGKQIFLPSQLTYFGSIEEAKAAAQADYERRILSALTTPPADIREENERLLEHIQELLDASGQECACGYDKPDDVCLGHTPLFNRLKARATAAEAREKTLRDKIAKACEWYWPADDTSSDMCADGVWGVRDNVDLQPGEILHYAIGGVFEYRYFAFLEPAEDADSDDEFEVDAPTEEEVRVAIDAELARRAALKGGA